MTAKLSKILKNAFWALLALVLLYFCFRGVDWHEFFSVLGQCRWALVLAAMAAGVLGFIIRALRWRLLLLPVDGGVRRVDCYDGFTIGKLCDLAVPHVGEFVRCGYVRKGKVSYDKALGTVVLERAWDIFVLLLLIVLLLVFGWDSFGGFFEDKILSPLAGRLNMGAGWLAAAIVLVLAGLVALVVALRSKVAVFGKITGFLEGIWQGVKTCVRMPRKWLFLLLTVALWAMFLMMSFLIIKALPTDYGLTIVDALFIMLVGSVAGIVPVPGGFGAFHYLVALALQTIYGIPFETGLIFATLSHESQAVTMVVCGGLSYVHQYLERARGESGS